MIVVRTQLQRENEHGTFVEQTPEKRTSVISETNKEREREKERIDIEVSDDQSKREEEC